MVEAGITYLDASALVKIIAPEQESHALLVWLRSRGRLATSVIARVEVGRVLLRLNLQPTARASALLAAVDEVPLSSAIVDRAAAIMPAELRSLDAIHLASALELSADLDVVVTYDRRMADAARNLGLRVVAPA